MDPAEQSAIEAAKTAVSRLRETLLKRPKGRQIRSKVDLDQVRAVAGSWFSTYRPRLEARSARLRVSAADEHFNGLLDYAEQRVSRDRYADLLQKLRGELMALRARGLALPPPVVSKTIQPAPDFSTLVPNAALRAIVSHRWTETQVCLHAGAYLAATIMIGGLLEGLFLARVEAMADKRPAFTAKAAPRDKQGKTRVLDEWTLNDYLEVAHELGWIGTPAKKISVALRDYRNLVHPQRELREMATLKAGDTAMLWTVFTAVASEIMATI